MTLRRKAVVFGSLQLALMVLTLWVASVLLVRHIAAQAEHQDALDSLRRVERAIAGELHAMQLTARDWSTWDQTYNFVLGRFPDYRRENLAPDAVHALGLKAMLFYDAAGELVHTESGEIGKAAAKEASKDLHRLVVMTNPWLLRHDGARSSKTAVLDYMGVHVLVVSQPIVHNDGSGPAAGTLLIVRSLDQPLITKLREVSGVPFDLLDTHFLDAGEHSLQADAPQPSQATIGASQDPWQVGLLDIGRLDEGRYKATGLVERGSGQVHCLIQLVRPRTDYLRAKSAVTYLTILLVAVGAIWGGFGLSAWDRFVFKPVQRLTDSVRTIGESGDPFQRVELVGRAGDELNRLAESFNLTLDELQQTQRELTESSVRFAAVVHSASDCVVIADADSLRLLEANQTFFDTTGLDPARLWRHTLRDVLGEAAERIASGVTGAGPADAETQEHAVYTSLATCELADSGPLELEVKADLVNYRGRRVILLIARDVTERRRIERLKDDLLSMISHELRSPLTTIIGWATILKRSGELEESTQHSRGVDQILKKGEEMRRLVDDLLNVNKMRSGQFALDTQEVRVGELLQACISEVELSPSHQLEVRVEDGLPSITCDPERICYVIKNLIGNAAKFSPAGGLIELEGRRSNGSLVISVRDEGVGIPADVLPHVFDRFVQADMSATRRFGGFGLGLFIARNIVEAHGGEISVSSRKGQGSTFTVEIPLAGPSPRPASQAG